MIQASSKELSFIDANDIMHSYEMKDKTLKKEKLNKNIREIDEEQENISLNITRNKQFLSIYIINNQNNQNRKFSVNKDIKIKKINQQNSKPEQKTKNIIKIKNNEKSYNNFINIYFLFLTFLILLFISFEQLEINLIIKGKGEQIFINNSFYLNPSIVIINGEIKNSCKKSCVFENDINNVTIKFNESLNSCENMFDGLSNIIEINLSNLDTSKVTNMDSMFNQCINLGEIKFGNINTSLVKNMYQLFHNCKKLETIDVSNFDTSSVTTMKYLFRYCESLITIDVSKFNTSNAVDMCDIFNYCCTLTSINISNFDTSKAVNMRGMFYHDYKLKYLDLSNFDTSSAKDLQYMFGGCNSLIFINLFNFKIKNDANINCIFCEITSNSIKICINEHNSKDKIKSKAGKISDCSDLCFNKSIKIDLNELKCVNYCNESEFKYEYNNFCHNKCPDKTYNIENEYLCLNTQPEGYYLDIERSVYKKCFASCKYCYGYGNEINNNCIECITDFTFLNETTYNNKNCYKKGENSYYFNESNNYICIENKACPDDYNKLIITKNKCIDDCEKDNINKYEYNNMCYNQCPGKTYNIDNEYLCLNTQPGGYYFELKDSVYKKCFDTCKYCSGYGNEINNNCIECINNYSFLNSSIIKNCYKECPYYFYFDDKKGIIYCTENSTCPKEYNKLIYEKKKCVNNCKDDNIYKYLYQKRCYEECPQGSLKSEINTIINDYYCKPNCPKEKLFEIVLTQECVKNCPNNNYMQNLCILNYQIQENQENKSEIEIYEEEVMIQDLILKNFEVGFTSNDYDTSKLDKGEDEVFENENMKITLTTIRNQKNITNNNMTVIDLCKCETMLRTKYYLNEDDIIYMKIIEIKQEEIKIPKIEFDVYSKLTGSNLIKLNLSVCENTKISLSIPIEITENLDKVNVDIIMIYVIQQYQKMELTFLLKIEKKNILMVIKWYAKKIVNFLSIIQI